MKDKTKFLTVFLVIDILLFSLFSVQERTVLIYMWDELNILNFNAYIVFSFVLSVFYYLSTKIK